MVNALQRREIYQAAIDAWGEDMQLTVAVEEMAELTKEICKRQRGIGSLDHIREEIADVRICLEQMEMIFDCGAAVDGIMQAKAARLAERVAAAVRGEKSQCDKKCR